MIAIVQPLSHVLTSAGMANADRLSTHEPREVATAIGGAFGVTLDLGVPSSIDTFFLGFTGLPAGQMLSLSHGLALDALVPAGNHAVAPTLRRAGLRHWCAMLAAPVMARYVRISGNALASVQMGVARVGLAIRAGYEFGGGRGVIDSGSATRRRDGGFGILQGARGATCDFSLADLSDGVLAALYAVALDCGETNPVLVIEHGGAASTEAIHWSLFARLQPYERLAPGETKWSLRIQDWV